MDKVAWIQWSAQVHTGKLPLTLLNLELIVDHDLPNEIGERPQVFPFQKEEEKKRKILYQSHCLLPKQYQAIASI